MASEADNTRERILEAAVQVFANKGFESATIREICSSAKANLAAVNYHFGDKRRLYIEAVKRAHRSRAEQIPLPEWSADTPPEKKLADFVLTLLRRMIGAPVSQSEAELMMREIGRPSEACQELVQDSIRPAFEALNAILLELVPNLTPEKRRLVAFSVVGQCLHYRVADPVVQLLVSEEEYRHYRPELLADHITDFTLRALRAP